MEGGHISGLNGLTLGFAKKRGIDAVCLLATMPQYAISLPNPKASRAIIQIFEKMLDFRLNLHQLDEEIKDVDEKMAIIEDKVKDVLTIEKEEPESTPTEKKIPGYIMEKIEKLFGEAEHNKAKALELKKELDRWDLYKLYEDRFLDLFKGTQ
jgi:proteasome assembly chaperone (PAC2) family protein